MSLINIALKMVGKNDFKLDKAIGTVYMTRLCGTYGMMAIRGKLLSVFYKNIEASVFVGRGVKLFEKRYLTVGSKTKIHELSKIDALSTNGVIIGSNVVLGKRTTIECTGSLKHLGKGLIIGDRTTFGSDCFFGAAGGIEVGEDVVAGQYLRFHSENHNYKDLEVLIKNQGVTHKGISVGNNCWIGSGVVFVDGSEIADGCVVAANAVVTKKFERNSIIGGIPARVIGHR